jgi:hypothetical protein
MKRYFSAGLEAARANLVPGLVLQALMVIFLLAYLLVPAGKHALDQLAGLKVQVGYWYALIAGGLAGGVLPEVLRVLSFQRGSVRRENWVNLIFGMCVWAAMGVLVDGFYRLQGVWFGDVVSVGTVVKKVLVDMLLFTPLIGVPLVTMAYVWRHTGFQFSALRGMLNAGFYRTRVLPVLFPNWAVWTPVVCVIYSLPPGLQIPVYAFAQAFWALVIMTLTKKQTDVS